MLGIFFNISQCVVVGKEQILKQLDADEGVNSYNLLIQKVEQNDRRELENLKIRDFSSF